MRVWCLHGQVSVNTHVGAASPRCRVHQGWGLGAVSTRGPCVPRLVLGHVCGPECWGPSWGRGLRQVLTPRSAGCQREFPLWLGALALPAGQPQRPLGQGRAAPWRPEPDGRDRDHREWPHHRLSGHLGWPGPQGEVQGWGRRLLEGSSAHKTPTLTCTCARALGVLRPRRQLHGVRRRPRGDQQENQERPGAGCRPGQPVRHDPGQGGPVGPGGGPSGVQGLERG